MTSSLRDPRVGSVGGSFAGNRQHAPIWTVRSEYAGPATSNAIVNYLYCNALQGITGAGARSGTGSAPQIAADVSIFQGTVRPSCRAGVEPTRRRTAR